MVYPLVLKTQHDRKSFSFQDASLQTLPVLGFSVIKTISGQCLVVQPGVMLQISRHFNDLVGRL